MDLKKKRIVKEGFELLKQKKHYQQTTIISKLKTLGIKVSATNFNRIVRNGKVGAKTLSDVADAIEHIIEQELGFYFEENYVERKEVAWKEKLIEEAKEGSDNTNGFVFHKDGRLKIEEKVAFLSTAKKEIIEFGVTLNSFSSYFFSRKEKDFKLPIQEFLQEGGILKCYLLDPDCNEARLYFDDRKTIAPADNGEEKIRNSIVRLKKLQEEFESQKWTGKLEIYTYKHIPNNYFLLIDGGQRSGKMMVSHYLYGEFRAKCPVFEFTKSSNADLFKLYRNSLKRLTQNAQLL